MSTNRDFQALHQPTLSEIRRNAKVLRRAIKYQEKLIMAKEKLAKLANDLQDLRDFNEGRIDSLGDKHPKYKGPAGPYKPPTTY